VVTLGEPHRRITGIPGEPVADIERGRHLDIAHTPHHRERSVEELGRGSATHERRDPSRDALLAADRESTIRTRRRASGRQTACEDRPAVRLTDDASGLSVQAILSIAAGESAWVTVAVAFYDVT
jgi:hypothetical protein